jgi:(1->4)-alpha-D-glucan 1-alpha-D-glucosylmutase
MEDTRFMSEVERFVASLIDLGWINSVAQTLVKLTATGVPDIYQGSELWDLNLADPDNRRTVDFTLRGQMLAEARGLSAEEAWRRRESGLPKLWLIRKVLELRQRHPALFGNAGSYEPLPVSGGEAQRVLAYMRGGAAIIVAPRLAGALNGDWTDTRVELPEGRWNNVLTDSPAPTGSMQELTARFPVALLMREEEL